VAAGQNKAELHVSGLVRRDGMVSNLLNRKLLLHGQGSPSPYTYNEKKTKSLR
jgi:hypothetical protein